MELLVVIAIIGILCALLLPVLSTAQKKRPEGHLHQQISGKSTLGLRMYADDSGGRLPEVTEPTAAMPTGVRFFYKEMMKSYVGLRGPSGPDDLIFACPADRANRLVQPLSLLPQADFTSYMFNSGGNFIHRRKSGLRGGKFDAVPLPSNTLLAAEQPAFDGLFLARSANRRRARPAHHHRATDAWPRGSFTLTTMPWPW